ncbi:putative uncharacterized protein [Pseudomonas sp. StFLB209]|uniref:hypothetical protein n=1 Tax=Pseudomonas sp. StFLB209 TaxID=1028989 RepID=UPI0004F6E354|nr:putative uncharacterized protein [Pseudomonas sp. StFLB209]
MIGYRFERSAQDDLHIHSRNQVQVAVVLLVCAIALSLPIAGVVFAVTDESSTLADMHPLHALMFGVLMLLIPALALLMLVYTAARETFVFSRVKGEVQRITRNLFGRRERVQAVFSVKSPKQLELRRSKGAKVRDTQLWLVMRDGVEQRLTSQNVPVVPGSKRTDVWLHELADYLQVAVPTEVVEPVCGAATTAITAPATASKMAAKNVKQRKGDKPEQSTELAGAIGVPARVVLTLVAAFMAVLELTRVMNLVPAFFTGRLSVSGFRSRPIIYYLFEQPWSFLFNLLFGIGEVLLIGFIVWRCLDIAIRGRIKS